MGYNTNMSFSTEMSREFAQQQQEVISLFRSNSVRSALDTAPVVAGDFPGDNRNRLLASNLVYREPFFPEEIQLELPRGPISGIGLRSVYFQHWKRDVSQEMIDLMGFSPRTNLLVGIHMEQETVGEAQARLAKLGDPEWCDVGTYYYFDESGKHAKFLIRDRKEEDVRPSVETSLFKLVLGNIDDVEVEMIGANYAEYISQLKSLT